ncbi:hypothetical protein SMGD1_1854 [Sulfurimonas gotlandica GD1]|jgi:hypothetical protein|uniref:Uncharacterized protein n=1 Tax=Sulfurimonas gotlandica (strain DSM 19862 / JCM 16533 / GD1) TaxID=929558 RepID=B6BIM2_SULGG|nr:hypothetical protein [Sulfurimonas gotlandica]EDZ63673.1 conserved hypothetical protein [Sulfurimonas gotlandica GD1]EHP30377.1 hypothetical protein SMGD1_1854 [Sulfurimonas gotlandica GD1]
MNKILKYDNLTDRFPHLQDGLCNAIQNEFLEIKKVNYTCPTYAKACKKYPKLEYADCVIYSPFMDKKNHDYETFIFIDSQGGILEHICDRNLNLYGMLENVNRLFVNTEYEIDRKNAEA